MAVRASIASGNFLDATTWALIDSTSYSNSETTFGTVTTSFVESSAFTPGAITVDGIFIKLASHAASPTGTVSVHLAQAGVEVTGTLVAINVSDLPLAVQNDANGGWHFFKFASPITLLAATSYTVGVKTSSANQIFPYVTAGTNWSRALRTTTTGAPAAGDDLIIAGEYTGAGTSNSFTVTMNETTNTDYGSNTTSLVTPAMAICSKGTLSFDTTVNSYLRLSGHLIVYAGGTLNQGTVATPVPRNKTSVLEFDCAADGDFGLVVRNLGTFVAQGLSRTSGKNIDRCKLNGDASVNATSLSVDTDTGWLSGDVICVASTTQTASQSEKGTLNGGAGASSLTVNGFAGTGGGVANAHSGTSPTQAEVILLTRNVGIRSVSSSATTFVNIKPTATVDWDWAECYYCSTNAVNTKRGIEIETTTGSCTIKNCSIHDCEGPGITINSASANNITVQNNVLWNILTSGAANGAIYIPTATTGTSIIIDGNIVMLTASTSYGIYCASGGIQITNNTCVSCGLAGINLPSAVTLGTTSGNVVHSSVSNGLIITGSLIGIISNTTIWRCASQGVSISNAIGQFTLTNLTTFGSSTSNVNLLTVSNLTINNWTANGDTTFPTQSGLLINPNPGICNVTINNSNLGTASGILTAHNSRDIGTSNSVQSTVILRNTILASPTDVIALNNDLSFVSSERHNQTAGIHKTWKRYGNLTIDTTTYKTASPALTMTPNNATNKLLTFPSDPIMVANGGAITITVYVYKSASYNGNQPRLIVKENSAVGITSDTVLATASGGTGSWLVLTGTTATVTDDGALQFYVDCDGTAGTVTVDDWYWTGSVTNGYCGNKYWFDGRPVLRNDNNSRGPYLVCP